MVGVSTRYKAVLVSALLAGSRWKRNGVLSACLFVFVVHQFMLFVLCTAKTKTNDLYRIWQRFDKFGIPFTWPSAILNSNLRTGIGRTMKSWIAGDSLATCLPELGEILRRVMQNTFLVSFFYKTHLEFTLYFYFINLQNNYRFMVPFDKLQLSHDIA